MYLTSQIPKHCSTTSIRLHGPIFAARVFQYCTFVANKNHKSTEIVFLHFRTVCLLWNQMQFLVSDNVKCSWGIFPWNPENFGLPLFWPGIVNNKTTPHAWNWKALSSQYQYYKQDLLVKLWQIISKIRKNTLQIYYSWIFMFHWMLGKALDVPPTP